jgi:hypothetical protein
MDEKIERYLERPLTSDGRKPFQTPRLRVLGATQFVVQSGGSTNPGDGGTIIEGTSS